MSATEPGTETAIPDLRDIPADRLAEIGGTALGEAIERYKERLRDSGIPLSSFQARI